ncbi:MAG: HAD family hydrolase [Lachnospiraceae bacterium]|nr:HAD family hydrolase [Lachnospiraceae bacterium]
MTQTSAPKGAALFFDIDGTLLPDCTDDCPAGLPETLQAACDRGHHLFINTGRTICSIAPSAMALPMDGYLCGCGSRIIFHNEVLFYSALSPELSAFLVKMARQCHMDMILEGTRDMYFPKETSRFPQVESLRKTAHDMGLAIKVSQDDPVIDADKFVVFVDEKSDKDVFFDAIANDISIIDRGNQMYECIQKPYTKATAIDYVRRSLGLTLDDIYVFGDSTNDLSMFVYAKHTVAMGEHSPALDPETEFVTKKLEDGGIRHALEHYHLI